MLTKALLNAIHSDVAVLDYQEVRPGVYDFYHTETPPSKRGQGIAAKVTTVSNPPPPV